MFRVLTIFVLFALTTSVEVRDGHATPPREAESVADTKVDRVRSAIAWLMRTAPRRALAQDDLQQEELAREVVAAAGNDLDPYLVLSIAFLESSLRSTARGTRGELGLMQVMPHGVAGKGRDLTTLPGQLAAGCDHLRLAIKQCSDIRGGIALYATGHTCEPTDGSKLASIVDLRLTLARKLRLIADAGAQQ